MATTMDDAELLRLMPTFLLSEDFAVLLGLKESMYKDGREPKNEIERLNSMGVYLRRNRMEAELQQEIVWARFCALYLPATVDKFLNLPTVTHPKRDLVEDFKLHNAHHEMLVAIQHSPYFSKYLRSSKPVASGGKQLPRVVAQRLVELGPRWDKQIINPPSDIPDDYYASVAGSAIQLLSTLCTAFVKKADQNLIVPLEIKKRLLPLLKKWGRRHQGEFLGDVSQRTWLLLSGEPSLQEDFKSVRRHFKNWDVCGMPNCDHHTNLKVCGRCQTVRYCSPEHQRQHWGYIWDLPHKQICHSTEY